MSHTEGPWSVSSGINLQGESCHYLRDVDGNILAEVKVINPKDVLLMVAAPSMLRLLSDALEVREEKKPLSDSFFSVVDKIVKYVRGES